MISLRFLLPCALLAALLPPRPSAAQRFDRLPTPDPGERFNLLTGIDGVSPRDAWAVGVYGYAGRYPSMEAALLLRWDGSAWTRAAVPEAPEPYDVRLNAVEALSPGDALAVGTKSLYGRPDAYVLRWDGAAWRELPLPAVPAGPPDSRELSLEDVFALSPTDVWMVGWRGSDGDVAGLDALPLVLHWDGAGMTHVPLPPVSPRFHRLEAVHGSSPDEVWAVGMYKDGPGQSDPLVYRWNGTAWAAVTTPFAGRGLELYDVAVLAPDDVWIAGGGASGGGPLVAHWDGAGWTEHAVPAAGSLAALAPDDVYLFGGPVLHWNGASWRVVDPLPDLAGPAFRGSATAVLPDGRLWAAGRTAERDGSLRTLVLRSAEPVRAPARAAGIEGAGPGGAPLALSDPAPNPFRGHAELVLALGQAAAVRVEAFDLLGRPVALLFDGRLDAGEHRLAFPAAGLAAGVYLVRATATAPDGTARVETRRAMVMR